MNRVTFPRIRTFLAFLAVSPASFAQFVQFNLVSDSNVMPAANNDGHLVNPRGVAYSPTGPFWVANNGSSTSTLYDGNGNQFPPADPLTVFIPWSKNPTADKMSMPTGVVFNSGTGFAIAGSNGVTGNSRFIFVTEKGTIAGWNQDVNDAVAIPVVDNSSRRAIYKGAAIAKSNFGKTLYATNFLTGMIDSYNDRFQYIGSFSDPFRSRDMRPFGIKNIDGFLVVTYVRADASGEDDLPIPGVGFIDVFSPNGVLLKRFAEGGPLNAPWGMTVAAGYLGPKRDALLIGNFGDGRINVYCMKNGHFEGQLQDIDKNPIEIEGLWDLTFGNGGQGGLKTSLYFTAGPQDEEHGLFGYISRSSNDISKPFRGR